MRKARGHLIDGPVKDRKHVGFDDVPHSRSTGASTATTKHMRAVGVILERPTLLAYLSSETTCDPPGLSALEVGV